jgi:hypothetical protein
MKTITNSEDFSESRIKMYVLASFPATGRFSPMIPPLKMQEKSGKKFFHFIGGFRNKI